MEKQDPKKQDSNMDKQGNNSHRTAGRVLEVFEYLAISGETTTLAALSARMNIAKSSLLPLLRTLVARQWVEQPRAATYRIPAGGLFGGRWFPSRPELEVLARPFLVRLSDETGECSVLGVLPKSGNSVVYIDKVDSPQTICYTAELGALRPLHCTSSGLAVLAFMPSARRNELVGNMSLAKFTDKTVTDKVTLMQRLDEIVREGVAVSIQEFNLGATAIAAPIRDHNGEVHAACALAGPSDRMRANMPRNKEGVKAAAQAISIALGWKPELDEAQ
ncbi:IclR family transcriptional regulator [Alcaligenaceae bacterium]|nr:IclR family transcriptional regulator [Alcaligenaceae bacterium]